MANIACKSDPSNHGGTITNTNADGTVLAGGDEVAVDGATLVCPTHGAQTIPASGATKTKVNGKLVLVDGDVAGCGAVIQAPNRNVDIE